jgi:rhodanese-related sulfurtransferase
MTPKELSQKAHQLVEGGAVLLDVRTQAEFHTGHPPAARNIPLQELPQRLGELGPPGTRVVVYCQAGGRSTKAADFLKANGYPDVFNLLSVSNW